VRYDAQQERGAYTILSRVGNGGGRVSTYEVEWIRTANEWEVQYGFKLAVFVNIVVASTYAA